MRNIRAYVSSLGRHGTTAFLCPMYGVGEVPQSFCRLCAVRGGVYILREQILGIVADKAPPATSSSAAATVAAAVGEKGCRGVVMSNGRFMPCNTVVIHATAAPANCRRAGRVTVVRLMAVCSGPLLPKGSDGDDSRSLCIMLPSPAPSTPSSQPAAISAAAASSSGVCVRCLQYDSSSKACPSGSYLVQLWARAGDAAVSSPAADNAMAAVEAAFDRLVRAANDMTASGGANSVDVLFRMGYRRRTFTITPDATPPRVHVSCESKICGSLHYESAVALHKACSMR